MKVKPIVLITGCSSGIGQVVFHGLKARGWRVFATARQSVDFERMNSEGLESLFRDLDDSASIRTAFAKVMARSGGRLDALFNNGGFGQVGAVEDYCGP